MKAPAPRSGWSFWSLSVLLHLLLVALAIGYWIWRPDPRPREQRLAIEASLVSGVNATTPAPPPEPVLEPEPEPAEVPEVTPATDAAQLAAAQAEHVAEERRIAEERLAAERSAQEEADRRKAEQATKDKAERDKKAREQAERDKLARDKAEQQRRQQLAERTRAQREAELNTQIAAEERVAAARASGQMTQYLAQITAHIERAWKRPLDVPPGWQCEVRVTQVSGGAVTGVQVGRCNGDAVLRQSIEDAAYRASPLPQPADAALFDRNLTITFRAEK